MKVPPHSIAPSGKLKLDLMGAMRNKLSKNDEALETLRKAADDSFLSKLKPVSNRSVLA